MLHHLSDERREALETATPERTIVLFYDQAIESLHEAISAIARNAIVERCNATTAAIEVLAEMVQCMELDEQDELAFNILRIHRFIISRLPQVNLYNDAKFAAEAVRLLRPLRDAFAIVERESETLKKSGALGRVPRTDRPQLSLVTPVA